MPARSRFRAGSRQSTGEVERSRIEIVRTRGTLEALAPEWSVLAESSGLPMLSHAWVQSCADALYAEDALYVITARARGVLVGVAPLALEYRAGVRRLSLIGASRLYEPSGLLYDTPETLDLLVRAIVDARRPVTLYRIPAHSSIIPRFRSLARSRGLAAVRRAASTVAVPISSGWDEYLARLSPRRRYDLRRAMRRASEKGTLAVRILSSGPEEVEAMFADFVRIESSGWKARKGSSLSQRHRLRQFFLQYATRASQSGNIRIAFLDLGGQPVAGQLSVEYADRLWVLKTGYDEVWSRCSPGWQLLAEVMRYAFEQKLKSYEFLGSDEPWLHGWITEQRELSTLLWYPATLSGTCALAADAVGRGGGRVASWLRSTRGPRRSSGA